MNNALKLVATDKLTVATQRPNRIPSNRQQEIRANLSLIARTWRTLSQDQRNGFTALGQTWSPTSKATATGFAIFQSLNGVRLNSGQTDILTDAPIQPDFIGKLPAYTVRALIPNTAKLALSSTLPVPTFSLHVVTDPFNGPVIVLATRPLSAGTSQPSPRIFRQIATLPALSDGENDLTDAYMTQFPTPAIGMKVAIQIYPITPNGFRGNPFIQTATVTPAP